ncbi:hypothetical protein GCM10009854_01890 [Saccharopolyspora halophila]|uniref:WXG100 family type VII secretion target n=1 Tax=Saccharopolyspora halophila TaxID=405551 RepID=A0ABN3FHS3_9PSEU
MREHAELTEELGYLARVADELEVPHAIPADAAGLLGRQQDLRNAAEAWRELAETVERSSGAATGKLGDVDAAWEGAGADAFLAHVREVGLAGNELTDTMRALAEALEHTAEALRVQSRDLRELVADAADEVREAMPGAPERARRKLIDLGEPVAEILEAVADSYRALTHRCGDLSADRENPRRFEAPAAPHPEAAAAPSGSPANASSSSDSRTPSEPETPGAAPDPGQPSALAPGATTSSAEPPEDEPAASAAGGVAGAAVGAAGAGVASGMMPMGMMGGMSAMLGRQGGRSQERTNDSRIKNGPEELFGTPPDAAPAVFGEPEEEPEQAEPGAARQLDVPSTPQPGEPKPSIAETLNPKN